MSTTTILTVVINNETHFIHTPQLANPTVQEREKAIKLACKNKNIDYQEAEIIASIGIKHRGSTTFSIDIYQQ